MLSCHPTVVDGRLASRHVDLRPYVFLGRDGDGARRSPAASPASPSTRARWWSTRPRTAGRRTRGCWRMSRPLIGVTTSEIRARGAGRPDARGRSAAARDGARDGLHARGRARRRAAGRAAAARPRHDRAAARPPLRGLPVGRPGHRPGRLRRDGAQPAARADRADLDAYELALAQLADARGMPVLGICRGSQAINVARGGTLHQHLGDLTDGSIDHRQAARGARDPRTTCGSRRTRGSRA